MVAPLLRVASWSGPRSLSTTFMRSWGNRPDTYVHDEPFYAHYLQVTGLEHPLGADIIAAGETDWERVREELLHGNRPGYAICFQKHMTHHLLPHMGLDWLSGLNNIFLIRNPARMLVSMNVKMEHFDLADLGFSQLVEIFDLVVGTTGKIPPIVDADDLLRDPRKMLTRLCAELGIPFMEQMLSWPAGPQKDDGVWASHWYGNLETSTGFREYDPEIPELSGHLRILYDRCLPHYQHLYEHRLV